jgi:hypothetical protein
VDTGVLGAEPPCPLVQACNICTLRVQSTALSALLNEEIGFLLRAADTAIDCTVLAADVGRTGCHQWQGEVALRSLRMLLATTTSERWPGWPSSARPARGPTARSERTADDRAELNERTGAPVTLAPSGSPAVPRRTSRPARRRARGPLLGPPSGHAACNVAWPRIAHSRSLVLDGAVKPACGCHNPERL